MIVDSATNRVRDVPRILLNWPLQSSSEPVKEDWFQDGLNIAMLSSEVTVRKADVR